MITVASPPRARSTVPELALPTLHRADLRPVTRAFTRTFVGPVGRVQDRTSTHADPRASLGGTTARHDPAMDDDPDTRTLPIPAQLRAAREALRRALAGLRPRMTMERDGLVLVALEPAGAGTHGEPNPAPPYLLFEQAVAGGAVEVREIGAGTVPSVAATTKDRPVVIFAGDTITGGKQNRVINISVWLSAGKVTQLPVTCLEHGRWDPGLAARFGAGRKADYALRSMVNFQVSEQRRRVHEFAAPWRAGRAVPGS